MLLTLIYSTIVDAKMQGYVMMPQVEEMLVGYLSPGSGQSLKKQMEVLQVYQADLLKSLSTSRGISDEAFSELY